MTQMFSLVAENIIFPFHLIHESIHKLENKSDILAEEYFFFFKVTEFEQKSYSNWSHKAANEKQS